MNHIDNIREIEKGLNNNSNQDHQIATIELRGYLKACEQTEKEVEELKNRWWSGIPKYLMLKLFDEIFTHKEAIKEGEKYG